MSDGEYDAIVNERRKKGQFVVDDCMKLGYWRKRVAGKGNLYNEYYDNGEDFLDVMEEEPEGIQK